MKTGYSMLACALLLPVAMTACNKPDPREPNADVQAAGRGTSLPTPMPDGSHRSVTGTPTDNGYVRLPPVTQVPAPTVAIGPNAPTMPVPGTPAPVAMQTPPVRTTPMETGSGPVAAVIGSDALSEPTPDDARRVIEDYFAAINRGGYESAWRLWSDGGRASGKSLQVFSGGFADTSTVSVSFGQPGPVDAGAGQRAITIPVRLVARQRDQSTREFAGTYTLARTVVDGASAEQRAWRIRSANINAVNN